MYERRQRTGRAYRWWRIRFIDWIGTHGADLFGKPRVNPNVQTLKQDR